MGSIPLIITILSCGVLLSTTRAEFSKFWLRQSINVPALQQLGAALLNPGLLLPRFNYQSINEIDADALYAMGTRYIVFDKDNTLSIPFMDTMELSIADKVASLKDVKSSKFAGKMAILSNSAGSSDDDDYLLAAATERGLGLPVIRHALKKPRCLAEVLQHFGPHARPDQVCVVGDRLLTDVMFGNMHGMTTILVAPLSVRRDHIVAVVIRAMERAVLLPLARALLLFSRAVGFART